jgi:hypothetical protein
VKHVTSSFWGERLPARGERKTRGGLILRYAGRMALHRLADPSGEDEFFLQKFDFSLEYLILGK